ncbi:MAG: response regulator [Chlamydiales bacterium]|nr:response regulator [Chlamydiales bacterium]
MTLKPLRKILVVDDDPDILIICRYSLEMNPQYVVKSVSSGEQAVKEATEFQPDLILLDILMPIMDGPATVQALRKIPETMKTPIVFFTASVITNRQEQFLKMGVVDIIVKPFDPLILSSQLQVIWERYQTT